ncbi:MAG: hypothetical protein EAZ95_10270 [Bacteroidetes bacterium]|nr:MAG: hypothetical protein EAZ95_10270 [Bacteroidota bacterium]
MKITLENTQQLTSYNFIERLSIELWKKENIYLIDEPKKVGVPDYFYITAYLIQFDTEFQMQGLTTLLTNSTAYNLENTLDSFNIIGSTTLANCLQDILNTLHKYGLTPIKMRERFLQGTAGLPEYSIITSGNFFKEEDLFQDLSVHEKKLYEIYQQIWTDLEAYLIKIRGK